MRLSPRRVRAGLSLALLVQFCAYACGTSDESAGTVGASDAGTAQPDGTSGPNPPLNPGADGGTDAAAGAVATYTVPPGGGTAHVRTVKGTLLSFSFPASAAGLTAVLTPTDPAAVGWSPGDFDDVIALAPEGTVFADPVVVRPSTLGTLMLHMPEGVSRGRPAVLPIAASGAGFELRSFSAVAIVPPDRSCAGASGWTATADAAECAATGGTTTRVVYACQDYRFCADIQIACCVEPATGRTSCELGDAELSRSVTPVGNPSGNYPYCLSDGGVSDAPSD